MRCRIRYDGKYYIGEIYNTWYSSNNFTWKQVTDRCSFRIICKLQLKLQANKYKIEEFNL